MKIKYTEPLWGEMNYRFSRNVNKERAIKLTDKKVNVGKKIAVLRINTAGLHEED